MDERIFFLYIILVASTSHSFIDILSTQFDMTEKEILKCELKRHK